MSRGVPTSLRIGVLVFLVVITLSATALWGLGLAASLSGTNERVSVDSAGFEGNGPSFDRPDISSDASVVAFMSAASNLVNGDTNAQWDIFAHDRSVGLTNRIAVSSSGAQSDSFSRTPSVSGDGRLVAFWSHATNLVPDDTNGTDDVFVHDRLTGLTTRVSVGTSGEEGNGPSTVAGISGNGRYVAFHSSANNLVADDTNGQIDVFVHDRQSGVTERMSVSSGGVQGNDESVCSNGDLPCAITDDGRFIAFASRASSLVADDTNNTWDIFLHDRQSGETSRLIPNTSVNVDISADGRVVVAQTAGHQIVAYDRQAASLVVASVNDSGTPASGGSTRSPTVSGNGRYVVFSADAGVTNLVPSDTNGYSDIFIHDLQLHRTVRVSETSGAGEANGDSEYPSTDSSGRFIAFTSFASDLVPGDENGERDAFVNDVGDADGDGTLDPFDLPSGPSPVGGFVNLKTDSGTSSFEPGRPRGGIHLIVAALGFGLLAVVGGGWHARRRWMK